MNERELKEKLIYLVQNSENEIVEFKSAKNNFDIDRLGKYFSAIGNEAILKNKQYGWIIFGIDDKTHEYTDTRFNYGYDFNKVKKQISDNTTDNITFIEIYELDMDGKRIIMFQVPAAPGTSINWKGYPYGRVGESLMPLGYDKIEHIKAIGGYDFTKRIIEGATIDSLDKVAIEKARKQFKEKYPKEPIDRLTDIEFLNKARLTLDGKITYAAMLLLGNKDYYYLMGDYNTRITWKLWNDRNIIDYEHFEMPFLINIDKAINKIRNLKYRYMVDGSSIFPKEVEQYDGFVLRELINNCVAHQDYMLKGYININEFSDRLLITNEGSFIPKQVEEVLKNGFSAPYYRNRFLWLI